MLNYKYLSCYDDVLKQGDEVCICNIWVSIGPNSYGKKLSHYPDYGFRRPIVKTPKGNRI